MSNLPQKQRLVAEKVIADIVANTTELYDVKKMVGHKNLYRIRKGEIRFIYFKSEDFVKIIHIGKRDEKTYRNY